MQEQAFWLSWAQFLQRWKLRGVVSTLLEASGPLSIVIAQLAYLGQPFLSSSLPEGQYQALAQMLEDPDDRRSFASFLREEEST